MVVRDTTAATAAPATAPGFVDLNAPADDESDDEGEDGMEEEEGKEEEEGEEEEEDASVGSLPSSITTGSTSTSNPRRRSSSSLTPSTRALKRTALVIEGLDVTPKDLDAYVNDRPMPAALADEGCWTRVKAPAPNVNRSPAWGFFACYQHNTAQQRRWYCQTTEACRDGTVYIQTTLKSTANVTLHLRDCHAIVSARSGAIDKKKAASQQETRLATTEKKQMVVAGGPEAGERYDMLKFVKNLTIGAFLPFNYLENKHVRQHYLSMNPAFPVTRLHHESVKHIICEFHSATQQSLTALLGTVVTSRILPSISIFIDVWEDKFCGKKFLGLRVRWICDLWMVHTRLLSLRYFAPSSELRDAHQVSNLLALWVQSCLDEYGLRLHDFVGSVTDSGSDVKRCCTAADCLDLKWEWCGPHWLNHAIVHGIGYTENTRESANEGGRALVMQVRKLITHMTKSVPMQAVFGEAQMALFGKSLKLKNMAMHRWSSAENTFYRVLSNWAAISRTYHLRSKRMELMDKRPELLEMYTLLRSINTLLKELQGNAVTSGSQLVLRINQLLKVELALDKPLIVVDPAVVEGGEEAAATGEGGAGPALPRGHRSVAAEDLTEIGKKCREGLRTAIISRFVKDRYQSSGDSSKSSYLFDAAALVHPGLHKMKWVDQMGDTEAHATLVKSKIEDVLTLMLEDYHFMKGSREFGGRGGGGGGGSSSSSTAPRQMTMAEQRKAPSADLAAAMSDDEEDAADAAASVPVTSKAWAKAKLVEYFDWCRGKGDVVDAAKLLRWTDLPTWWLKVGTGMFPELAQVFQALLAMPGGAASLERDFSIASNVLTVHRSQLDQAFVEMTMLLHMNLDKIPPLSDIPKLSTAEGKAAMPPRLRNKEDFKKFLALDREEGTDEEEEKEEEEDDAQASASTKYGPDEGGPPEVPRGRAFDDGYGDPPAAVDDGYGPPPGAPAAAAEGMMMI